MTRPLPIMVTARATGINMFSGVPAPSYWPQREQANGTSSNDGRVECL